MKILGDFDKSHPVGYLAPLTVKPTVQSSRPPKMDFAKYSCWQCDHEVTSKASLSRHIRSVHERVKYPCNLCTFKASRKYIVNKHVSKAHTIQ